MDICFEGVVETKLKEEKYILYSCMLTIRSALVFVFSFSVTFAKGNL